MNKRIKKKKYLQYLKSYLMENVTKKMKINWNRPIETFDGKHIVTINQRYNHMINQRTRCNSFIKSIKERM